VVDAKGHTNVPGVFAAGDCTTVPYKQIVIAAGEGAKAALSAFDHLIRALSPLSCGLYVKEGCGPLFIARVAMGCSRITEEFEIEERSTFDYSKIE